MVDECIIHNIFWITRLAYMVPSGIESDQESKAFLLSFSFIFSLRACDALNFSPLIKLLVKSSKHDLQSRGGQYRNDSSARVDAHGDGEAR